MKHAMFCAVAVLVGLKALAGCSSSASTAGAPAPNGTALTYYKDVKPITDAKCAQCHVSGGLAPFPLLTYSDVVAHQSQVVAATSKGRMPPWPPNDACATYAYDRSLLPDQITTIGDWVNSGAAEGDPSQYVPFSNVSTQSLSRIDTRLTLAAPYTPQLKPDDYHCFLLDWPQSADSFVTGFGVKPGAPSIVHHALIYAIPPAEVAAYQAYETTPGAGYTCFGGPNKSGSTRAAGVPTLLGGWAPGVSGSDFPADTGIKVAGGSKLVVQVHYNTLNNAPVPDQTELDFKVDSTVKTPAYALPWTNPSWVRNKTMFIAAGNPDVSYSFSFDAMTGLSFGSKGALKSTSPATVWSASLHMHLLGTHATLDVTHSDGTDECYLDILHWNFHWQGAYAFAQPKTIMPGDKLNITCHWDNSPANQPDVGLMQQSPMDVNWGEGTQDEMCLGFLYVTQ
jgi:hypothetical protein